MLDCGKWLSSEGLVHFSALSVGMKHKKHVFQQWFLDFDLNAIALHNLRFFSIVMLKCGNNPLFLLASHLGF